MYAHVTEGVVDRFGLPDTWRRDDGSTVSGYQFTDARYFEGCLLDRFGDDTQVFAAHGLKSRLYDAGAGYSDIDNTFGLAGA